MFTGGRYMRADCREGHFRWFFTGSPICFLKFFQ